MIHRIALVVSTLLATALGCAMLSGPAGEALERDAPAIVHDKIDLARGVAGAGAPDAGQDR